MTYNKKVKPYHIWIKKRNSKDDLIINAMELPKDTVDPNPFVRRSELKEMVSELKAYIDKALDEKLANVALKTISPPSISD